MKYGTASWVYGEELSQQTRDVVVARQPQARVLPVRRTRRCATTTSRSTRRSRRPRSTPRPFPRRARRIPLVDLFVYDVATRADGADRRPRRQAVRQRRRRPLRLPRVVVAGRPRAALLPHEPPAERDGGGGGQPGDRRLPRRPARRVADRLGQRRARAWCFSTDGRRFIWESQRNGWNNFYLYDLRRRLDRAAHDVARRFEAATLIKVDERAGVLFYTARDGDNFLKLQLHRVGLDGKDDRRLTDPAFHHTVGGCIAALGSRPEQPAVAAPVRHLAGQPLLRRRLPDARHAAGHPARRRAPTGAIVADARGERHDAGSPRSA